MTAAGGGRPQVGAPARSAEAPPLTASPRRRRRRWPIVLLVVLLVLAVLAVVAFLVADRVLRDRAETQIEQTVGANLPDGIRGRFTATVGGRWVLPQLAKGEFDEVTLVSRGLTISGAPASAHVRLSGLPVSGGPVGQASADLTVGQAVFRGIPALREKHASDPAIGRGTVSTTVTQRILNLPIKIRVVLKPTLADQVVLLRPTAATITAGPASVPATAIVQQLLPNGITVCAASYLPKGVTLQYLRPDPGEVTVGLNAFDVDLQHLDTTRTGSCG